MQGEYLFTVEANFHQSCHKSVKLKHINHLHDTGQSTNCAIDTVQDLKAAAHVKIFTGVFDFIQDVVIGQNQVV